MPRRPCEPSPCGSNAICRERNGAGSCTCRPQYFGDPYTGCRPECVLSSDCPKDRACINNKCNDPCPGTCGLNAQCRVINHIPSCSCLPGFTGDSLRSCILIPPARKILFCILLLYNKLLSTVSSYYSPQTVLICFFVNLYQSFPNLYLFYFIYIFFFIFNLHFTLSNPLEFSPQ